MSNYITIESGYYEPFKENETDPELKIWADKYFEIIKKIHEVLLPYENSEHLSHNYDRFAEYMRRIRDKYGTPDFLRHCFTYDYNAIASCIKYFNDSCFNEKVLLELKEELRECFLHRVWYGDDSVIVNESNIDRVYIDRVYLERGYISIITGVWEIRSEGFKIDYDMICNIYNDIISMGISFLSADFLIMYILEEFNYIHSCCSIIETYKNFQSGNIEKVIKDKIKCGGFKFYNNFRCSY